MSVTIIMTGPRSKQKVYGKGCVTAQTEGAELAIESSMCTIQCNVGLSRLKERPVVAPFQPLTAHLQAGGGGKQERTGVIYELQPRL